MEGVGELIDVETVRELKCELAEAYKAIAEKEAEVKRLLEEKEEKGVVVQMLLEKIAVLEKRHLQSEGDAGDREPEVEPSPILERKKAEEILPKECWGLVFQNLIAEDLLSCRQVCKTFNQLLDLKEFKVQWKFKLILPLLFPYLISNDPENEDDPYPWKHLCNARLVCRSWRQSIEKYTSEVHGTQRFLLPIRDLPIHTSFRTSKHIEEFQQMFGECNENPFPSRLVFIKNLHEEPVEDEDNIQDYYNAQDKRAQGAYIEKIGELLEQFGMHIFRLWVCFEYLHISNPDALTLYKLTRKITIHLPNLKEFTIWRYEIGNEDDKQKLEEAASYAADNALAVLPKLRVLRIGCLNKAMHDYLLDAFAPQLTHLERHPYEYPLNQAHMEQLKNVRKLSLTVKPNDTLESLRFLQSPLRLLKLTWGDFEIWNSWNVDKLLRNLKHLPIEVLEIQLCILGRVNLVEAGIDIEEYNNASIKTLIIHIYLQDLPDDNQISFNFLQALTKLENLEFICGEEFWTTHPGELPEVVKLNEYLFGKEGADLLYHSNVWEKVPSLRTFTLTREDEDDECVKTMFTRQKYESFRIIPEWFFKA